MRRSARIDELLKIGFTPGGSAWAQAPAGERAENFPVKVRARAKETHSRDLAAFYERWAAKWEEQNR